MAMHDDRHDDRVFDLFPIPEEPPPPQRRRSAAVIIACVAILAVVAGAVVLSRSGDDPAEIESATSRFAAAGSLTLDSGSARVTMTVRPTDGDPAFAQDISGVLSFGDVSTGELTFSEDGWGDQTLRWVGEEVWMSAPGAPDWYELSSVMEESTGVAIPGSNFVAIIFEYVLHSFDTVDPASIEPLGTQEIDGATTQGYSATFDLRDALEVRGVVVDPVVAEEFFSDTEMEGESWIDDEGRARRVVLYDVHETIEITFSDFGVPVAIEEPDEVLDLSGYQPGVKLEEVGETIEPADDQDG